MPNPEIGIVVTAANETEAGLNAAGESVKAFSDAATQTGAAVQATGEDMSDIFKQVGESCDLATHAAVENGREIKQATKEYKLANIEQMQYNQILQMTGATAVQWGSTLQGQHNLVKAAINGMVESLDRATGGFSTYIGAGIQVIGMGIEMYAQYMRMMILWGMHAQAIATSAGAQVIETAATWDAVPAQAALNAVMALSPAGEVALAIGAIGLAVAGIGIVYTNWTKENKDLNQAVIDLSNSVDEARVKIQKLYGGETNATADLEVKVSDLGEQYDELGRQRAAAASLGFEDEAEQLSERMGAIEKQKEIYQRELELQRSMGPSREELLKAKNDLAEAARQAFLDQAEKSGLYETGGGMDVASYFDIEQADKDAKEYGMAYANAYAQGVRDGAYSPENQAIMDEASEKLGENFEPGGSPPAVGPLHEIDKWGMALMETFAGGMVDGSPNIEKALSLEVNKSFIAQVNGRPGGGSTVVNSSGDQKTNNITVQFYLSGVDEEGMARNVMKKLNAVLG